MPKRTYPPLTEEQLKLVPYGNPKCRICQLDPKDIEQLHTLRYNKGWTYAKLDQYIKHYYKLAESPNKLSAHFRTHTIEGQNKKMIKGSNPKVVQALAEMPKEKRAVASRDLEDAYTYLTRMCEDFTKNVHDLHQKFSIDEDRLNDSIEKLDPLRSLERLGALSRDASGLIAAVTALRAPKIMVANFLRTAIDEIIFETGAVLSNMCSAVQLEVHNACKEMGIEQTINEQVFGDIFRKTAEHYQNSMMSLRREQMAKATAALADLEKII